MDELNYEYEEYGKQRTKMENAGFVFENISVNNGVFSMDVLHKETGNMRHFSVEDGTAHGYFRLTNSLSSFEKYVQDRVNEYKDSFDKRNSASYKNYREAEATGYALNKEAKDELLGLMKAEDESYLLYLKNPTKENREAYLDCVNAVEAFENDENKSRSFDEALPIIKETAANLNNQNKWNNIIEEFGQDSPEAVVAMDMIELEDSVRPAEDMFKSAEKDSLNLTKQIEAAEEYANKAFVQDLDQRNFQMFDLRESLAEEQIADIVEKNPICREDESIMDTLRDTFRLKDVEGLSQTDINAYVESFAKDMNDQWKSQHPILATIEMLKEIPENLKNARENTIALGQDYKTNVEKVADSVALKAGTFYNSAKMSAVERIQNVAEKSASIYKEACSDFHELVGLAKKEAHKALANVVKASDIVLDSVTLGTWSNHCEKLESLANDKGLREVGYVGYNTYEGQILDMMEKDPNGIFSRMEQNLFKSIKKDKDLMNFIELDEKVSENSAAIMTSLRHKILSGMDGYDSTTYWQEINDYAFAELQGTPNPADSLKELAEKINEKGFELDQKFGVFVDNTVDKAKAKANEIKENVVDAKDAAVAATISAVAAAKDFGKETAEKVKYTFSKEHIDEMKASVVNMCNETKAKIATKANQVKDSVKNSIASAFNHAKEIGEKTLDKAAIAVMSVKVMGLESTASVADKVATLTSQAKRKCEAQINALTEFDKVVHDKIEDINQAINNISSITPRQKVPYEMSEQTKKAIETLQSTTEPSPVTTAVLNRILDKEAKKEKMHNAKETVLTGLDTLKDKLSSLVKTAGAKAKLTEMHGWGKAAETAIKASVDKLLALDKTHGLAGKIADTLTQAANQYQSKIDELTDDYQR